MRSSVLRRRRLSRRKMLTWSARLGVGAAGLALVGCGDDDEQEQAVERAVSEPEPEPTAVSTVEVALKDFTVEPRQASVPAGEVTFNVENQGPTGHMFVVFRTDLPEDALPLTGSQVQEDGEGVTLLGRIDSFPAGRTETLTHTLAPGRYVLICNIPGHYQLGMRVQFSVE